jgi:hypothetical protein
VTHHHDPSNFSMLFFTIVTDKLTLFYKLTLLSVTE